MNKPVAIVLGGTAPHIALIENLKNRGYYTILVDYFENPPAKTAADEHIRESTLDQEKVLDIARQTNANLVISACVDQANLTACYVAEKLGLPAPYSYETALKVTNKGLMKQMMLENDIPTSKHVFINKKNSLNAFGLKLPVVVKPADSCGSKGVRIANSISEVHDSLNNALNVSRTHTAVVEEIARGFEVSVYSFVKKKKAHIIMIAQRHSVNDVKFNAFDCYATIAPADLSEAAYIKIQDFSTRIANVLDLENTPLHVQAFIDGDKVSIIEFAPRAGGGFSYKTIKMSTGFDIIDATIDSYLGNNTSLNYSKPKYYYAINLLYSHPGVFSHIEGSEELIANNIIEQLFYHKTKGMEIMQDIANPGHYRVGAILLKGNTKNELIEKAEVAIKELEVYDNHGSPIMNRNNYLGHEE